MKDLFIKCWKRSVMFGILMDLCYFCINKGCLSFSAWVKTFIYFTLAYLVLSMLFEWIYKKLKK
jgi:hypothetical protein